MQALLLVDLQNEFFPGGALAVPKVNQLFPLPNEIQNYFSFIVASKDHHPANHKSFASLHRGKKIYDVKDTGLQIRSLSWVLQQIIVCNILY